MSTAVAAPPPPPPNTSSSLAPARHPSPRHYALAPSASAASTSPSSNPAHEPSKRPRSNASPTHGARSNSNERTTASAKVSPNSHRGAAPPMIKVKKEPSSPSMQSARPRPKRLDLSSSTPGSRSGPQTARPSAPLTARDSAGLAIQDVGLACLSPGFQTHDPAMRNQLQRSLDVRDQQRQIIEARQKGVKPGSSTETSEGSARTQDTTLFGVQTRTPTTSRRKGPPPGLSINAPSAEQFAHDRVIQSAPLHQTFTGLRPGEPYTRHAQHGPSGLSQTSHIHHVPATQTNNRLPPIADVFANDRLDGPRSYPANESPGRTSHATTPPPVPSPGFPPAHAQQHPASVAPLSSRAREFRSAEEAVQSLTHGRDELKPKVVHYGGVQPPTPPSPMPAGGAGAAIRRTYAVPGAPHDFHPPPATARPDLGRTTSTAGRRRGRDEYERDNGSPPSAFNRPEPKRAAFAVRGDDGGSGSREDDWRQNMSGAEKREEFLRLCERAWDLFHS